MKEKSKSLLLTLAEQGKEEADALHKKISKSLTEGENENSGLK